MQKEPLFDYCILHNIRLTPRFSTRRLAIKKHIRHTQSYVCCWYVKIFGPAFMPHTNKMFDDVPTILNKVINRGSLDCGSLVSPASNRVLIQ